MVWGRNSEQVARRRFDFSSATGITDGSCHKYIPICLEYGANIINTGHISSYQDFLGPEF
jgi:hypothetical protein